uniref:Uncharacterized protein n=1 Tax=Nelumbo nucifera TaxID=4432 RepID=A0A822Y4R2_NELNU|nr:TPA_asm: hypothetical protein HUJ06_028461 [Nelumbo nucifera]
MAVRVSYLAPVSRSRRKRRRRAGFRKQCLAMAKQQKTRFYIIGRCLSMLLCWHAHALPD